MLSKQSLVLNIIGLALSDVIVEYSYQISKGFDERWILHTATATSF